MKIREIKSRQVSSELQIIPPVCVLLEGGHWTKLVESNASTTEAKHKVILTTYLTENTLVADTSENQVVTDMTL